MLKNRTHSQRYPRLKKFAGRIILATFATALVAIFISAGINANAFIFQGKNETAEVYSLEANGDWENEFQAVMLPEVGEEEEAGSFSGSNSAIYEGESREIILSDFSATRDELESITEDEEIINDLQQKTGWDSSEFHESILEQETGQPQPNLDLPGADEGSGTVQEPEATKENTNSGVEQGETGNFLEIASLDTAYLNARDEASLEGNIISKVKPGETYEYEEEKDGWYKIKINEKKSGWVFGEYVVLKNSPENQAEIEKMEGNKEKIPEGSNSPADLSSITKPPSVIASEAKQSDAKRHPEQSEGPPDFNYGIPRQARNDRTGQIAAVVPMLRRDSLAMTNFGSFIKLFRNNKAEAKNKVNFGDLVGKEFTGAKIKMSFAVVETPKEASPKEEQADELPIIENNSGGGDVIPPDETESSESEPDKSEPAPVPPEEPESETTEPESGSSPEEGITDLITEKIRGLFGTSKANAEEETGGEENETSGSSESIDTDIDAKIIIWYSLDGENWEKLDTITQSSTSNGQNGGYFSFDAPFLKNWQDLKNLRVKLEGAVGGETNFTAYLDSVWAEVEYQDAEGKNVAMRLPKKDWQKSEQPRLEITDLVEDKSILEKTWEGTTSIFSGDSAAPEIKVKLTNPAGEEIELERDKDFTVVENQDPVKIEILPDENLPPGKYAVEVSVNDGGEEYSFNDEFTWGVLAINANKSIYAPGEKGNLAMAVLNETGNMVCNAKLELRIVNQELGVDDLLSTENEKIKVNEEICNLHGFTLEPDYEAEYQWGEEGTYELTLTAETANGTYTISDKIEVKKEVPFDAERITATRIYPPADYPVTLKITANQNFEGEIMETVPGNFEILPPAGEAENPKFEILNPKQTQNSNDQNIKQIVWEVDIKKGDKLELSYEFNAPDVSPEFYLLGPLKFIDKTLGISFLDQVIFQEARQWQIAADAASDEGILGFGETAADDNMQFLTYVSPSTYTDRGNSVDVTTETNDIFHVVVKDAPTRDEIMAGHLKAGGLFNVIKCTAGCTAAANWSEQLEIAAVSAAQTCDATAGACEQVFDIAYEQVSGRAFVAYGKAANDGIIYYNIWNGSGWAGEASFTFNSGSTVDTRWVRLVARGEQSDLLESNEILLIAEDANSDIFAARWDGDSFENLTTITTGASVPNRRPFDGAWESNSTHAVVVYAEGTVNTTTPFKYKEFDGTSWDSSGTNLPAITSSIGAWVEMASHPQSNRLAVALEHFSTTAATTGMFAPVIWKADGSTEGWTLGNVDTTLEAPLSKGVAAAWENYNGGTAFAMFLSGDQGSAVDGSDYETWTAGGTFSAITDMPGAAGDDPTSWKLYASPNSDEMMAILADNDSDMCVQRWSGTAWDADCSTTEYSTTLPPDSATLNKELNSFGFSYKNVYVQGSLGKTSDGWAGAVPVYLKLGGLSQSNYPYARASTAPAVGSAFYTTMTWSAANDRFEGTIYPGSNYCNGCADPNTGTFTVTVQLDNNSDFSSIDYSASAGTFTTYITRRWNAINNTAMGNSTEFNPTWNAGGWWDYSIEDLSVNAAATYSNVAIAIPFHPTTASITNMAVTLAGVSLSQGTAASTTDCWWWDSEHHTLYVQDDSLGTTYKTITLNFDSDTDLFATRIDQVETYNMGVRLFYNGLLWGNNYIGTAMFGGGHEGAGEQMELQARDFATNDDVSIDCMERVAVHVGDTIAADASAYYSADIKWKQQEWADYIVSEDNNSIVTRVNSDGAASGWQQQLNNGIAAERTQTFYANKRYIKNEYQLTNNGASTRIYPLVWGREQWIGTDRDTNDEGRYDGDTVDRTEETHVAISSLTDPWMTSYDTGVFAGMGMCFQKNDPARYGYFLTLAALTNATPWAEWVNQGTEYRPDDNDAGTNAIDTFFDRNYSSVAPSGSVTFNFLQWGYDTTSWANIESAIDGDCKEFNRTYEQYAYRWYQNNDSTDVGAPLANQNTSATLSSDGQQFRLRTLLSAGQYQLDLSGQDFKLQYVGKGAGTCASPSGGTPSTWTDVTASTAIAYNNNATPADGAALTANANDPTHTGITIRNQTYEEANNFTNSQLAIAAGEDGKWDFALKDNTAPDNTTYCFRAVKANGNQLLDTYSQYPEINTLPPGVTVSGTVYTDEAKTTPITDGRTVHLFVNSTDYSTTTTSSGDYSFSSVTVAAGDSVIAYLDGVAEDGSTVTLALDSTTAISNLDIITAHISLEHRAAGPITNADLDDIDGVDAGDEDGITIASGNATFADNFELSIVSGENYTPGGTVTCDDFETEGTGTFAPGANAVTVSGDWEFSSSGTFTTSETVTFDGALAQTIITGTKAFSGLTINNTGTDGANDDVTISGALDINGTFAMTNGDLKLNTNNPNVNTAGDVTIGSSAFVTKGTGTWTFDKASGIPFQYITDSSAGGPQDLGAVVIDNGSVPPTPPPSEVTTNSNIKVTTLNIHSVNDFLDISSDTLTISGSGTPFVKSGTFTITGSTVIYSGTSATNITVAAYNNLTLTPASGSVTYSLAGDLTSGNSMTGTLTISSGATLDTTAVSSYDITLAGSWSNSGTFTRNSSIVTFNGTTTGLTISDGGSAFYDLVFSGSGGEWLYTNGASTAPTNSTSVSAGTPTFLNARTGTVSVTSGTLNVDWYLGTHVVDAATLSNIPNIPDGDITISAIGTSDLVVYKHNGSTWGSGGTSQTTSTDSNGKNPQPNSSGAIRIREYSMTASASCPGVGCTLYRYNEQIVWVSTYGEYDYYDDYGENYLTSCWAGSTSACSNDTVDDDVIGSGWYRAASGTMNGTQPYSGLNSPPLEGSWYVGMLEAINFDIDSFSKDFGTITPGGNPIDISVPNTLTVTTSASHGYVIYTREEQPMTCSSSGVCGSADIDNWGAPNSLPTIWNNGSFGFGYSTNDYNLQGGTVDRFSGPKFAGFIGTGFGDPVADRSGPTKTADGANVITYRIAAEGTQNAGPYQTSIYYVVVPMY